MRVVMSIIVLYLITCSGCTLNFKGKEVDLHGQIVTQYKLSTVDIMKPFPLTQGKKEVTWTDLTQTDL